MKFTKLAKSDKFEYMMLSRLIQDAKYFIEHPDLKHLWARTLDEHIKQMKEQYATLDPKPEWTSEEEINNLAKQMKESYKNHWNEVHPDNKIEAAIQQPNKPKPTTMLPDNMQWAWDPDAADWVAVLKDNSNTTPPLYDPNNQNVVNNTTTYMSNIKSASVIDGDEDEDSLSVKLSDLFLSDSSLVDSYIKNEINCDDILNALNIEIKNKIEYKKVCDYIEEYIEDNYIIKSSSNKIQSALKLEDLRDINGKTPQEGMWLYYPMIIKEFRGSIPKYLFQVKIRHSRNGEETPYLDGGSITKGISYVKKGILFDTYEEADKYKREHMSKEEKEYEDMDAWAKTKWQLDRYSSCLSEFLDGPQFSKEIKIEAGLIKDGLVKYAGFDFNRGTKYAITTKGLEVLRKASEAEHNEALNEREKLAYMFGFNTDEVSTLDTTGKVIKSEEITDEQLEESWNKYYPLYRKDIEEEKMTEENYPADDEVAQKLKTTLSMYLYELKRYRKAIPIMKYHTNKKMKRAVENGRSKGLNEDEITKQVDDIAEEYYKKENKIKPTFNSLSEDYLKSFLFGIIKNKKSGSLNKFAKKWTICEADGSELGEVEADSELDAKVKFGIEHSEYVDSQSICAKEVKAGLEYSGAFEYNDYKIDLFKDTDDGATFVIYAPKGKTVNHESMYKGTASTMDEAITKAYNIIDGSKKINAANKPFESTMGFYTYEVLWQDNDDKEGEFIEPIQFKLCQDADIDEWSWQCEELFGKQYFHGFLTHQDAMDDAIKELNTWGKIKGDIKQIDSLYTGKLKQLHSKYEETTESHEPYPNPSETPHDDIVLENHDGWVNTASFEDDMRKQFQQPHQKLPNSDRDLELLEKQVLDLIDEDKKEQIKALFDRVQFSDKEAAKVTPEFSKLHKLLGEYKKQNLIQLSDLDGNLVASGDPQIINELEHQVKEIGYYCESVDEYTDSDYAETYSLKIFMK